MGFIQKQGRKLEMDTVLITGTTSGIGKAFVEKFASMGNNIILVSKNRNQLQHQQIDLQTRYQVMDEIYCVNAVVSPSDRRSLSTYPGHL